MWQRDAHGRAHGAGGCHGPRVSGGDARGRRGIARGTSHLLSNDSGRWALNLLPRGGSEGRPVAALAPRPAVVVAHVRAALRTAVRSIPPCRTGLSWISPQRLAGPQDVRVHV